MITNTNGISEGLLEALSFDEYTKGGADFSATELITPSRIVALTRRNADKIHEDASDLVYRILGRAVHSVADNARLYMAGDNRERRVAKIMEELEKFSLGDMKAEDLPKALENAVTKADDETVFEKHGILFERRHYITVDVDGVKITVSGQMDYYNTKTNRIKDYKLTSRYVSGNDAKDEWEKQMNIYAYMLRENGYTPEFANIEAIYRDWSKSQAQRDPSYPQKQIESFEITLWPAEKAKAYVHERVKSHLDAISKANEWDIPVCTKEERWEKNEQWAVTKKDRARAIRVLDTKEEAQAWIGQHKRVDEVMTIEHRPGDSTRCKMYCPVKDFCSFAPYFTEA